ncbi:helix-turn-helix domain-containing protein [Bordetella trematum]|uniref:helix-turn-helix domain-containing protein n=1 Tax=Bordetella trematum TaxID=123899 RepID=UPI000DE59896|nr:Helix-turn-helix domain [Bordetella trematum]
MSLVFPCLNCPDPWARAPLAGQGGPRPRGRLLLPPASLQGAVAAIILRDTRGLVLSDAQRLTHLPASALVSLSWFEGADAGQIISNAQRVEWQRYGAGLILSGSHARPTVSWAQGSGRAGMICFHAQAAQTLFQLDLAAIQDASVDARAALGDSWRDCLDALAAAQTDEALRLALERHVLPRWQRVADHGRPAQSLRAAGREWVDRLAWLARDWRRAHSPRHVERRIKAYSGRSLREWQSLVRTEALFFAAREQFAARGTLDWAAMAHDEGFADQAHLSRAVKRITGFAPAEFARRFAQDESFWLYRLWV